MNRRPPLAVFTRQAVDTIRSHVVGEHLESGGTLGGESTEDGLTFVVTDVTGPGPGALREQCRFRSDEIHQRRWLRHMEERRGARVLGEWHSHPGNLARPSSWDERELEHILESGRHLTSGYLAGIANWSRAGGFHLNVFRAVMLGNRLSLEGVAWVEVPLYLETERAFDAETRSFPASRRESW